MFNRNLDSILKTFNKTTADLETFISRKKKEREQEDFLAMVHAKNGLDLSEEIEKATIVKSKIEALIN